VPARGRAEVLGQAVDPLEAAHEQRAVARADERELLDDEDQVGVGQAARAGIVDLAPVAPASRGAGGDRRDRVAALHGHGFRRLRLHPSAGASQRQRGHDATASRPQPRRGFQQLHPHAPGACVRTAPSQAHWVDR
jgi:hypothetical protein